MSQVSTSRPLRWAMVGGGAGSEIGPIHRAGAARDCEFVLLAGAFDLDPDKSRAFGRELGLDAKRCYGDYKELLAAERSRPDGVEVLSVATPNGSHYEICKAALKSGLHVVCEKPLTLTSAEAEELSALAASRGLVLGVAYGYSAYPMIHQARAMVKNGELGDIRMVHMQFAHGYHAAPVAGDDSSAGWRSQPAQVGSSYVLADIGTHAYYLGKVITGLRAEELCCFSKTFVETRAPLEDNAYVWIRYENGAQGVLWASAVNTGSTHDQSIRVIGSKASVEWRDEFPNQLTYSPLLKPAQTLERGMGYLHPEANFHRVGAGHPEGFFDAWANMYSRFAYAIRRTQDDDKQALLDCWHPSADDGVEGVRFVERCVESARAGSVWVRI